MLRETPLTGYKGMTLELRGLCVRKGQGPRKLVTHNDLLEFAISEELSPTPLLTKRTGLGIEQSDSGKFVIVLSPTELSPTYFPESTYHYVVRITEGNSNNKYLIRHGPLYLIDVPFLN